MKFNRRFSLVALIVLVIVSILCYAFFFMPTKVALVNFRDSQMAEIVKANDNWFIQPEQINLEDNDFSSIVNYPVIYLFHISTLTEEQRDNLKIAMENGAKVHVFVSTSKENDFSNIAGDDLEYIKACFENDGEGNLKRLLNYSRKVFNHRSLFISEVTPPEEFPKDVFYRIGTETYYTDLNEYWSYYKKENLYKESRPVIAIINSGVAPQTQFRSYQDSIILNLENRGFNVAALSGFQKRFDNLQSLNPDMVIYFPHGRINMRDGDKTVEWLKERNILVLIPQLVFQPYKDWIADQQGMAGGIFGQNIVVPELDGAIHPYAVAAEYKNEQGFHTYKPIPGRVNRFCETAERWLSLKVKPNAEKKLCIYYYKGAGKNAMVAGGLEVGESILSLLKNLKTEGYNVGDLPDNINDFLDRIHTEGPLLGDYAEGTFEKFLKEGHPALIPVQEYERWCKSELAPESYQDVLKAYGPAPGTYMTTTINDTAYLAIPRVQFGNISLLPVLSAALEENEFKLVHGVKKAPPHAYIASYLWSRMGFKTDVVAHFGAHGSVEFTPWKQVVLSLQDWPEALIAPVPHLYVYSIDNIGEAMMAKRRTYATMVSHLTPAYSEAELYGDLKDLGTVLHNYNSVQDKALKEAYQKKIRAFADTLDLFIDLGLSKEDIATLSDETVEILHNYVHHLEREKITTGLHTLGVSFTADETDETLRMMVIDPLSSSLKQLAKLKGELPEHYDHDHTHHHHDGHHADDDYQDIASNMIVQVLKHHAEPLSFISKEDQELIVRLELEYGDPEKSVISEYYGGSYASPPAGRAGKKKEPSSHPAKEKMVYDNNTKKMVKKSALEKEDMTDEKAKRLVIHLSANRKIANGIAWLKDEKAFKEISSLLDKRTLHRFETAASMNPEMQKKVDIAKNEHFVELLQYVQDSTKRQIVISWLKEEAVNGQIQSYRSKMDEKVIEKASGKTLLTDILYAYKTNEADFQKTIRQWNNQKLTELKDHIHFFIDQKSVINKASKNDNNDLVAVQAILNSDEALDQIEAKNKLIDKRLTELVNQEKLLLECLLQLKECLLSIHEYEQNLISSPELELAAFTNGMNGGFVAPSSGGDPISNPLSVPTGKNLYSINAEITPTKEAFEIGQTLAEQVLHKHIAKHGDYPKKIAYSLWGGEFIRNQGMNIGQIFYMLGVEPVRNQRGRVHDVKLIPIEQLKRPRIDVVVQTSGQFRDIAASRIYLINKAIELASNADDGDQYRNYVKAGTLLAEKQMKEKGMSPEEARRLSTVRVFGGVNGHYGTGIMELVEQGDKWETEQEIADRYIQNMGAMYAEGNWSQYREGMFETMLQNTEVVIHPRSSNVTGPISLDHVYEFMGGITASIRVITGKDPDGYFNDYRNKFDPQVQGLKEAIWTETRTNLFNPKFIKAQLQEGETAAENFAENFRDTYGWNVMKPDAIDKEIWEGYYDIYVKDKLELGTLDFFKEKNPYALQEMTAVMLETIRKGYWKPDEAVTKDIVNLHAELVKDYQAGCSGFVCDNAKLKEMIERFLTGELKESYNQEISDVRTGSANQNNQEGMVLEKEEITVDKVKEILKDNMKAVITLILTILLIGGAVTWGIVRRRRMN